LVRKHVRAKPNINNIRIFGSLVYYKTPEAFTKKLDPKAIPYYLIGFKGENIYKLYNPRSMKSIDARDCKIIEGYYYKPNTSNNIQEVFTKLGNNSNNVIVDIPSTSTSTFNNNNNNIIEEIEDTNSIEFNSNLEDTIPTIIEEEEDVLNSYNYNNSYNKSSNSKNKATRIEFEENYSKDKLGINNTVINTNINSIYNIINNNNNKKD
jgi:hypothetical protein